MRMSLCGTSHCDLPCMFLLEIGGGYLKMFYLITWCERMRGMLICLCKATAIIRFVAYVYVEVGRKWGGRCDICHVDDCGGVALRSICNLSGVCAATKGPQNMRWSHTIQDKHTNRIVYREEAEQIDARSAHDVRRGHFVHPNFVKQGLRRWWRTSNVSFKRCGAVCDPSCVLKTAWRAHSLVQFSTNVQKTKGPKTTPFSQPTKHTNIRIKGIPKWVCVCVCGRFAGTGCRRDTPNAHRITHAICVCVCVCACKYVINVWHPFYPYDAYQARIAQHI